MWMAEDGGQAPMTLYSVETPLVGAVLARRGEILAVAPTHPTANALTIRNAAGFPVLRSTRMNPRALADAVERWQADGVIRLISRLVPSTRGAAPAGIAGSKGGKGSKGANRAIGATPAALVPLVPRATCAGDAGANGTNGAGAS